MKIKKPPIIVFVDGISFIPNHGNQTQKIPPITSVKDSNVNSAAGIFFEAIEYIIRPKQTIVPCNANKDSFLLEDKKFILLLNKTAEEIKKQNNPAKATVVNFGVSFLHLKLTENTENPIADARPVTKPTMELFSLLLSAIIKIPTDAMNIAIHTFNEISSFRNKKPNSAVIKGIAAKHIKVIAAVVCVIDQINVIIAVANPRPPISPEIPIFL